MSMRARSFSELIQLSEALRGRDILITLDKESLRGQINRIIETKASHGEILVSDLLKQTPAYGWEAAYEGHDMLLYFMASSSRIRTRQGLYKITTPEWRATILKRHDKLARS